MNMVHESNYLSESEPMNMIKIKHDS